MHHSGAKRAAGMLTHIPPLSWPASSGPSSIPEAFDVTTAASGILDRPIKSGDDTELAV
jgi:hypothetical protein